MSSENVAFKITSLEAKVPEGVPLRWQGKEFSSGSLVIELDDTPGQERSRGVLDYSQQQARAEFHVRVIFPEFARTLNELGVEPALTQPLRAVLRSEGDILDDHSFALTGQCELEPHELFPAPETAATVLPGR